MLLPCAIGYLYTKPLIRKIIRRFINHEMLVAALTNQQQINPLTLFEEINSLDYN